MLYFFVTHNIMSADLHVEHQELLSDGYSNDEIVEGVTNNDSISILSDEETKLEENIQDDHASGSANMALEDAQVDEEVEERQKELEGNIRFNLVEQIQANARTAEIELIDLGSDYSSQPGYQEELELEDDGREKEVQEEDPSPKSSIETSYHVPIPVYIQLPSNDTFKVVPFTLEEDEDYSDLATMFSDVDILKLPFNKFFNHLRNFCKSSNLDCSPDEQYSLEIIELDVKILEDDIHTKEVTPGDFIDLFSCMKDNSEKGAYNKILIKVTLVRRFLSVYKHLKELVESGKDKGFENVGLLAEPTNSKVAEDYLQYESELEPDEPSTSEKKTEAIIDQQPQSQPLEVASETEFEIEEVESEEAETEHKRSITPLPEHPTKRIHR